MAKTLESYILERVETLELENERLATKITELTTALNESIRKLLVVGNHLKLCQATNIDKEYIYFEDFVWSDEKDFGVFKDIIGGNE